jgi:methionyl-tRNA formyltransferase
VKICIAGKNAIAVNALKFLLDECGVSPDDLFVCPNKTDNGEDHWQPSLKKFATEHHVKVVSLEELYEFSDLYFFSLEFDRIIKPNKFKSQRLYNIHFSLLPKYKGMFTSVFPLLNGDSKSGVTLHLIDSGIDTGDIIAQTAFELTLNDTCRDLYFKYLKNGEVLFKQNFHKLLNGDYSTTPQPALGASYFSRNSIDFQNIAIDLKKTSFEIHNQVRAFIFPEYQLPYVKGYPIIKSTLTSEKMAYNTCINESDCLILSGIDGYKMILEKAG